MSIKLLTTRSGRKIRLNTNEEEKAVNAGIAADPDTYEIADGEFKQLKRGRPLGSGKKDQITLRLDSDIVAHFRASGNGWQTRINAALKSWVRTHA